MVPMRGLLIGADFKKYDKLINITEMLQEIRYNRLKL